VARELGYAHFDSGAVYRAVTLIALEALGEDAETWVAERLVAAAVARGIAVRARGGEFVVRIGERDAEPAIRSDAVTRRVSRVAAMAPVRDFVNALLRAGAADGGVVMDGRDIGTVVFPDAEVKVFLVADADERARRRLLERGRASTDQLVRAEAEALLARDRTDSTRDVAPLRKAPDAVEIDTTRLGFAEQVAQVVALARRKAGEAAAR
jgi:cytidylate kinase